MATDRKWNPKDDEINEGEEDEEDVTRYMDQKDAVLFAIHVSPSMIATPKDDVEAPKKARGKNASATRTALECAYAILQSRIISAKNDMMGILLFGTEKTKFDNSGFPHCYQLLDLDVPDADGIKALKGLLEDEEQFEELMVPSKEGVSMANVLFGANQILTVKAPNFQSRRLFIITDDDDPHTGNQALRESTITRAKDLYDLGVQIEPFFIQRPGKTFDTTKFYDNIIYREPYEDDDKPLVLKGNSADRLKEMVSTVRSKATPKRAQFSVKLEIGPGLVIGVKGYLLFKRQEKGRSHYIYSAGEKLQIVEGSTANLADETMRVVQKGDIKKAYKFGGEHVIFTQEEMKQMRQFGEPVIRIIGFKDMNCVKFDHNVKPSTFIYPDEKDYVGSTRTFAALHAKLVKSRKVGTCWCITRRNAAPALCALWPSEEVIKNDKQTQPAGFFLIQLPFADDVRKNPEVNLIRAPPELINRMRDIVKVLHLPNGYDLDKYENPSLQWHYRTLQAIALDEDMPEGLTDKTMPKYKLINKHAGGLISDWKAEQELHAGQLQSSAPESGARKRAKEEDADGIPTKRSRVAPGDVRDAYRKGLVGKLTVAILKEFLTSEGLDASGKKADLVDRVEQYLDRK